MWTLGPDQHYECPTEFQDRLTYAGGVNRYDEPNFKIVWGKSCFFRAGGIWECENYPPYTGYRDLRLVDEDCWVLLAWAPAETEGTPESYYVRNFDEDTGLQVCGEYAYSGKYEIVQPLVSKEMVNGRLVVEAMPLNSLLVDLVVPTILLAQDVSLTRRKAVFQDIKRREDERQTQAIGDSLEKGRLAYGSNPVSYAGQIGKVMALDNKIMRLKRNLTSALDLAKHLGQGTVQG